MGGDWTSDLAAFDTAVRGLSLDGSEVWAAMGETHTLDPTVVICITDAEATDTPTPELEAAVALAPPSIYIHAADAADNRGTLDDLAAITGGAVVAFDAADPLTLTTDFLEGRRDAFYELRWQALPEGPDTRAVEVTANGATAMGSYDVPGEGNRAPRRISAVYLDITVGGETVRRQLVDAGDADDTELRAMLLGSASVAFEAGPPTTATLVDDLLTARLSTEPLARWVAEPGDFDTFTEALAGTLSGPGARALAVTVPIAGDDPDRIGVHRLGLTAVLHRIDARYAGAGDISLTERVDVLRLGPAWSGGATPADQFDATLDTTAAIAIAERDAFDAESTAGILDGVTLEVLDPLDDGSTWIAALDADDQAVWQALLEPHAGTWRLVPTDGAVPAFWSIDPATGGLLGVISDGSGGGVTIPQEFMTLEQLLGLVSYVGSVAGVAGPALGGVAILMTTLIRMWGIATAVIQNLGSVFIDDEQLQAELARAVCNVIKMLAFTPFPTVDKFVGFAELLGGGLCDAAIPSP